MCACVQAIGDVVIGSVLGPSSQRANECRIAMFLAGYPEIVPVRTVNRCDMSLLSCLNLTSPVLVARMNFSKACSTYCCTICLGLSCFFLLCVLLTRV